MECTECGECFTKDSGRFSKTQWAKGHCEARCKTCVAASGNVGGYTNDGRGGFSAIRDNESNRYKAQQHDAGNIACSVSLARRYGAGAFKDVFRGHYTSGTRRGEDCVVKQFRRSVNFKENWFDLDILAANKTGDIVAKFNALRLTRIKVRINIPTTTTIKGSGKFLLEPFVHNWLKFNSNTGWYRNDTVEAEVMQALSHFSYHSSGGQFLVCDLQGGVYSDGVILSDPIVHSRQAGRCGGGDFGVEGISTFFFHHRCNDFCQAHWQVPRVRDRFFEEEESSSLLGNRGVPQACYIQTLPSLEEYGGGGSEDEDDEDDW